MVCIGIALLGMWRNSLVEINAHINTVVVGIQSSKVGMWKIEMQLSLKELSSEIETKIENRTKWVEKIHDELFTKEIDAKNAELSELK